MGTDFYLPEQLVREEFIERQIQLGAMWTRILHSVDPDLSVVFVKPSEKARAVGLEPGRWHVKRKNRGLPDSYMPVTGPDGGYREPDDRMLSELSRRDMWRTAGVSSREMAERRREAEARERDKLLRKEQMRDMVAEDYRAARRTVGDDPETSRFARGKPKKETDDGA